MDLKGALMALEAEMVHTGLNQLTFSGKVSEIRVTRNCPEGFPGSPAREYQHLLDAKSCLASGLASGLDKKIRR